MVNALLLAVVGSVLAASPEAPRSEDAYRVKIYPISELIKPSRGKADPEQVKTAVSYVLYTVRMVAPDTELGGKSSKRAAYFEEGEMLVISQTPKAQEQIQLAIDRLIEYRRAIEPKAK